MDEIANMNAATSAMAGGDYNKASQYLDRAGSSDHAQHLRKLLQESIEAKDRPQTVSTVTYL